MAVTQSLGKNSNPAKESLLERQQCAGVGDTAGVAAELHAVLGGTQRGGGDLIAVNHRKQANIAAMGP
jgi:hypothetical protein